MGKINLSLGFQKLLNRKRASYNEIIVGALLELNNIDFDIEVAFNGLVRKRYDFYIEDLNMVIEVMGEQHYRDVDWFGNLDDIQENDKLKKEFVINNGMKYVAIDCMRSEIPTIRNNIKTTDIAYLLDGVDEDIWKQYTMLKPNSQKLPKLEMLDIINSIRNGNTINSNEVELALFEDELVDIEVENVKFVDTIEGKVKNILNGKTFNSLSEACNFYDIEYAELKIGATYYKHTENNIILSKVL